jgi:hypothetical protein
MFASPKHLILSSAILLAGLPAIAAEESGVAPVSAATSAHIKCRGISNVPMTADAAQALPLRQIGTLSCGENVVLLADNEGYTAHVQSSDGKNGYVARMYLETGADASNPLDAQVAMARPVNGVVRWRAGAPGCDQFMSQGRLVESATANGITVQISLQDTGWKLRASVAVSNESAGYVDVLPSLVTLDELQPNLRILPSQDPAKLAHASFNHQIFRTAANAEPSPSAVVLAANGKPVEASLAYRRYPVSDYLGQQTGAAALQELALKMSSVPPGQRTAGVIWFERDPDAKELSMRFVAGDLVFDFPLSFEQKK